MNHLTQEEKAQMQRELKNYIDQQDTSNRKSIDELTQSLASLRKDIAPMIEMFSNIRWGEKILLRIGAVLGGLIAFILGILEIIRIIKK